MTAMQIRPRPLLALFFLAAFAALAACGGGASRLARHPPIDMVTAYGVAVRWNEWEQAWSFLDKAARDHDTPDEATLARLKLIKVTGYDLKSRDVGPDGIDQVVEIRYVPEETQREHTLRDHQHWRMDPDGQHYWLTSGLPEF